MATLVSSSFTQGPVGSSVRSSRHASHPRSPRPSDAGREMPRRSLQGLGAARPWSSRRRCSVRLVGPAPSATPRSFGPHGQVAPVRHRRGRSEFVPQHHYTPSGVSFLRGPRQGLRARRGWSCTGPQTRSDGLRLRIDGRDCRCRPRHVRFGLIPASAGEPLRDVPALIVGVQMVWFGAHNLCCRSVSSHAWSPTLAGTNGFGVQYSVRVGGQLTGTVSTMPTNTMLSSMLWPRSSWTRNACSSLVLIGRPTCSRSLSSTTRTKRSQYTL